MRRMGVKGWLAPRVGIALALSGCSFLTASGTGTTTIHRTEYHVDFGVTLVSEVVCGAALIAWLDPDAFAPTQGDASSWAPGDRDSTISAGQTWSLLGCATFAAFGASAIYGHHYAVLNDPDDGASGAAFGAAAAAFGTGFVGAQHPYSPPPPATLPTYVRPLPPPSVTTYSPPAPSGRACFSDYDCGGVGYTCVKPNYSTQGTCAQTVNSFGTPTYNLPDLNSTMPKAPQPSDCHTDIDCPIGFRCDVQAGACVK